MTRDEHVRWCKERALEYLNPDQYFSVDDAYASMLSDLGKHEETFDRPGKKLMVSLRIGGYLQTEAQMRKFIEGFN